MKISNRLYNMIAEQPIELPVFNPVALDLLQLLAEPDIMYFEVIRTIKQDEALSARVLKMSNSTSYAGRVKCETIENSAIRLGTQQIANIAIAASHASLHCSDNPLVNEVMQDLWLHSHACALGCRSIALKTSHQGFADHAYMAGLLHDIGKLYLLKAVERTCSAKAADITFDRETLHDIFSELHVEFGGRIMECWNIPRIYHTIVTNHHNEQSGSDDFLLAIVRLINFSSKKFNVSPYPTKTPDASTEPDFRVLQLKDSYEATLEAVMTGVKEVNQASEAD